MKEEWSNPPKWADRMLGWFCSEEHFEILQGDLHELYEYRLEQKGKLMAKLHYIKDAFDMLRPFALKKRRSHPDGYRDKNNTLAMFKNYFKISLRNMLRHKVYAGINIVGLSLGIVCFLLIFLYVQDELSYDRYHEHADDIYRVITENYNEGGEISRVHTYTSPMHGVVLRNDYAQVVTSVRFNPWSFPIVKSGDKQFEESFFNFVEPTIFDVFSFGFIEGNAENSLKEPFSVVLTESTARKYFEDEPAFGKTLKVIDGSDAADFKVTGVIRDFPDQSHMSYNFLASWATYEKIENPRSLDDYYGNYNYATYVRLEKNVNPETLKAQMPAMLDKNIADINGAVPSSKVGIRFQKLTGIHLNSSAGAGGTTNSYYITLFSAIGILVLLIACINYMNLSTAKYSNRLKEIGVRKVLGARETNISHQFLAESLLYAIVALILGFALALLVLPSVNSFTDKHMTLNPTENFSLLLFVVAVIFGVGLLAGSYPAAFMSRFKVVGALKGGKADVGRRSLFRTSLVVFQFTITIGLVIGVVVVERQIDFIKNEDPGFDRELVVNYWASPIMNRSMEVVKAELEANPNIVSAATSSRIPTGRLGDALNTKTFVKDREETVNFRLPFIRIDEDFLDVYNIDVLAGSGFSEALPDSVQKFLLNETAVKRLGFSTPQEAVGQRIEYGWYTGFVEGVVEDFHFESMHAAIQPMILMNDSRNKRQMSVKILSANIPSTMSFLENQFKKYNPERTFNASFVDDLYDNQYKGEQKLSDISKTFSVMAILIASLGLLGLVSYTMEQRAKEICVRKVLGASVNSILVLVNKRYAGILLISFIIATPIAYYLLSGWLDSFAYHISIGAGLIAFSGLLAGLIAVVTICTQAMRVAMSNPIQHLRNE